MLIDIYSFGGYQYTANTPILTGGYFWSAQWTNHLYVIFAVIHFVNAWQFAYTWYGRKWYDGEYGRGGETGVGGSVNNTRFVTLISLPSPLYYILCSGDVARVHEHMRRVPVPRVGQVSGAHCMLNDKAARLRLMGRSKQPKIMLFSIRFHIRICPFQHVPSVDGSAGEPRSGPQFARPGQPRLHLPVHGPRGAAGECCQSTSLASYPQSEFLIPAVLRVSVWQFNTRAYFCSPRGDYMCGNDPMR